MAEYLHHQGQYARLGVLFSGSYITRLIMGMCLLDMIRGAKKIIVPSSLGLETMRFIGMVRRYGSSTYVMIMPSLEIAKGEGDETDGSQPAPQPQQEKMDTEASLTAREPPLVHIFSPSRVHDRSKRVLQTDLVEVRATQVANHTEMMARLDTFQQILERDMTSPFVMRSRASSPSPAVPASPAAPGSPLAIAAASVPTENNTDA